MEAGTCCFQRKAPQSPRLLIWTMTASPDPYRRHATSPRATSLPAWRECDHPGQRCHPHRSHLMLSWHAGSPTKELSVLLHKWHTVTTIPETKAELLVLLQSYVLLYASSTDFVPNFLLNPIDFFVDKIDWDPAWIRRDQLLDLSHEKEDTSKKTSHRTVPNLLRTSKVGNSVKDQSGYQPNLSFLRATTSFFLQKY